MTSKRSTINRRAFLATGSAGIIAGLAQTASSAQAATSRRWDRETDILCAGSGAAGLCAAISATANGDHAIVIDKAPMPGGTTFKSGAAAWLPNNSVMRAAGMVDDQQACLRYMCRYAYPRQYSATAKNFGVDQRGFDLLTAFYANAAPMEERLRTLGALDLVAFQIPGSTILSPDYAALLPEDLAVRGRTLWPHPAADGTFGGAAMITSMTQWLKTRSVDILTNHRATRLVMDGERIIGLDAEHDAQPVRIRARKGVIFASGGYAHNLDLIRVHQPALDGSCAMPSATGDFVSIAGAVGASMGNLGTAWRMQVVLEEAMANRVLIQGVFIPPGDAMILVNKYGKRVVDEKRNYNDRTTVHFVYDPVAIDYPNRILFMIFDQRAIDIFGGAYPIPPTATDASHVITGSDWADLATNIRKRLRTLNEIVGDLDVSDDFTPTLTETVSRFNHFATTGHDEDFHRGRDSHEAEWQSFFSPVRPGATLRSGDLPSAVLHPFRSAGPYFAIILAPGALDTCGGPMIDANARVLGADGKPIPGLFGAGNCIASPTHGAYFGGGGTIGPALTFGYIAANSAHG